MAKRINSQNPPTKWANKPLQDSICFT
jgi:hypothetical protein